MHSIPRYRKLYELLRKHILEGVYPEGSILPSENELCALHHLTRPTVRKALDALVNEGYIKKHQGKGSVVSKIPSEIGILSITGTTSAIGQDNLKTRIIVQPHIKKWEKNFFFPLSEIEREFGCIYMERLRLLNSEPVFYDTNMVPNIYIPRFCRRSFEDKSLFETLKIEYGIEIKGGEQRFKAIPADKKIAEHLKIKPGQPVIHLERKLTTNKNHFNIYSSLYCNTEKYSLYGVF